MLTAASITKIVELSLQIALEVLKSMPEDQKKKFWDDHQRRMDWWQGVFDRIKDASQQPTA